MSTSSTLTGDSQTFARELSRFLAEQMAESDRPALSARVANKRKELQKAWDSAHPGEKHNPFTQEEVARRIGEGGITLAAYGRLERKREPSPRRLREIAEALWLDQDYFLPDGDVTAVTARLEAEADALAASRAQFDELVEQLQQLLGK